MTNILLAPASQFSNEIQLRYNCQTSVKINYSDPYSMLSSSLTYHCFYKKGSNSLSRAGLKSFYLKGEKKVNTINKVIIVIRKYYYPCIWLIAIGGFVTASLWAPNTSNSWPAFPFIIGLVALFFALRGEMIFYALSIGEYFIASSVGMIWVFLYGMVFCIIMGVIMMFTN